MLVRKARTKLVDLKTKELGLGKPETGLRCVQRDVEFEAYGQERFEVGE
jgi:hypothetical protein